MLFAGVMSEEEEEDVLREGSADAGGGIVSASAIAIFDRNSRFVT